MSVLGQHAFQVAKCARISEDTLWISKGAWRGRESLECVRKETEMASSLFFTLAASFHFLSKAHLFKPDRAFLGDFEKPENG